MIYAIGATFFNVGISQAFFRIKDALKVLFAKGYANPWIFFDQSVLKLGMTWGDINLIIIVLGMMLIVAILREKYGYARIWISKQSVIFRWIIWYLLFVIVLIYGKYGPGYNASDFIYQGF